MVEAGVERSPRHHREQRDIRGCQPGRSGNGVAALRGRLCRDPDAQAAAVGRGGRGARFDGGVERGGNGIFGGDFATPVHRFGDVAFAGDAIAVAFQRGFQRLVDPVGRDRFALGFEHGREAVERAVRRPPVARDRRDPLLPKARWTLSAFH